MALYMIVVVDEEGHMTEYELTGSERRAQEIVDALIEKGEDARYYEV